MSATRSIYRVVRSVLFSVVLTAVGLVAAVYIVISLPAVQDKLRGIAEKELSELTGGSISIGRVSFFPFNELRLNDVNLSGPDGKRCAYVGHIGAGIDLWNLIAHGDVIITYAEVVSLDAKIIQPQPGADLNIQFLIDAFKPKEKKKPSKVRVTLHNIVIRKSALSFSRTWIAHDDNSRKFNPDNISISSLNADLSIPLIEGDSVEVKLRRLAFHEQSGIDVKRLSFTGAFSPHMLRLADFTLEMGNSDFRISDQKIPINGYGDIVNVLSQGINSVIVSGNPVYPSDFSAFLPQLAGFDEPFQLYADLSGSIEAMNVNTLTLQSNSYEFRLDVQGEAQHMRHFDTFRASMQRMHLHLSSPFVSRLLNNLPPLSKTTLNALSALGDVDLDLSGDADMSASAGVVDLSMVSSAGGLDAGAEFIWRPGRLAVSNFRVKAENLAAGALFGIDRFGSVSLKADGNLLKSGKSVEGSLEAEVSALEYEGRNISDVTLALTKAGNSVKANIFSPNPELDLTADADIILDKEDSHWNLNADFRNVEPTVWGVDGFDIGEQLSGVVMLDAYGNSIDNIRGNLVIDDARLDSEKRPLSLDNLDLSADVNGNSRIYSLDSPWLKAEISGEFSINSLKDMVAASLHKSLPILFKNGPMADCTGQYADIHINVLPCDELYDAIKSPVRPGEAIDINARYSGEDESVRLRLDAPYIVQGNKKLIKNTSLEASLGISSPASLNLRSSYPVKHDIADLDVRIDASADVVNGAISWVAESNAANRGSLGLRAALGRDALDESLSLDVDLDKSSFVLNNAEWQIMPAKITLHNKTLEVNNIHVGHDYQFININGRASSDPLDVLTANLAGVDIQYVFDILNINHVDFGGIATGKAMVSSLFSGAPVARTENLKVKDLAYNGCVLGDGDLFGSWDNETKMVGINADIQAADTASAKVRGGIFVTRDSLTFDFDANKVDVRLLQPFMSGFTSKVTGKASGHLKLYGNFSTIDLDGRVFADTITMKVDHTNVTYGASDSVFFSKGLIDIPPLRLYDKYGNSGVFSGQVRHNYLKDARMNFELRDASHLLVFDADSRIYRNWNGRVFASGNAALRGLPGVVMLDAKMRTDRGTLFNIELDETQTASEYPFLTFSDRRAELDVDENVEESFEEKFNKKTRTLVDESSSMFSMDLAIDVNHDADIVLVMDPAAGDKIRATGNGALQMHYDTDSDDYTIYGKYTLEQGNYNFSLQDLILKNFTIRPGSSISFNGDPLSGILDITAAFRVNTNLTDLDASFKDDPDLKRTTVPVDALLKVTGDIHAPEINFDLNLPTVTAEVERKLRSLISSEDMLNRQVIYLLALNRFYTPSYATVERGGEFASVASSTLSAQIQNIIGSMTDKVSLAPSIKSDRSDLSDLEFDVALSSSLFDDRLLINGNLGYRDKSTSQTTFVGDFDLEYLLTRNGQLRLKAYNHFNDASYYLKSALTTQGIGIMYRKEFDDPFSFLKKKKKDSTDQNKQKK